MIPSSACLQRQTDKSGPAGNRGDKTRSYTTTRGTIRRQSRPNAVRHGSVLRHLLVVLRPHLPSIPLSILSGFRISAPIAIFLMATAETIDVDAYIPLAGSETVAYQLVASMALLSLMDLR